jgi:hypothetical protein
MINLNTGKNLMVAHAVANQLASGWAPGTI